MILLIFSQHARGMCFYSEAMAQIEHDPRDRRYRGERHVRTTEGVLLPHVRPVRRGFQSQGPVLGADQVGRIASSGRVDLLVGYSRIRGRSSVHYSPARLPR